MSLKRYIALTLCVLFAAIAAAQGGKEGRIMLSEATDGTLTMDFVCPWDGGLEAVEGYVRPDVGGMDVVCAAGLPALPSESRLLLLPKGAALRLLSWSGSDALEVDLGGETLLPSAGATLKDVQSAAPPLPDKEAYGTAGIYRGTEPVTVEHLGTMGVSEVYRLTVAPFHYRPLGGVLGCSRRIEASLELTSSTTAGATTSASHQPPLYLVVARPEFREGLQPFVQWKRMEGYDVDELYVSTNKRDTIRALIAPWFDGDDAALWPQYILLVGDVEQMQAFIGSSRPEGLSTHCTDLYYAEHTGDYLPDAMVGRWPVNDTAELNAVVRKTLAYEQGTALDSAVLRRLLLVAGKENSAPAPVTTNGQVNYVAREAKLSHPDLDTVSFRNPSSDTQIAAIVGELRQGAALVNYTAHCTSAGWQYPTVRFNTIDTLGAGQPMFFVNNCCQSNDYGGTCFGEQLLRKPDGGAAGVIGATNSTLWNEDYYWAVGPKYPFSLAPQYDSLRTGAFDRWIGRVGDLHTAGAILQSGALAVSASGSPYDRFYWEIYCLLGDPSMRPWVGVPQQASITVAGTCAVGADSVTLHATAGATVSVLQDSVLLASAVMPTGGTMTIALRQSLAAGSVIAVATGPGLVPAADTAATVSPQHGFGLYNVAATDSAVAFEVANTGSDTIYSLSVVLHQDSGDYAAGAELVPDTVAIDTLLPGANVALALSARLAVVGPRPRWQATLVATDGQQQRRFAVAHAVDIQYPTIAVDLLHADGSVAVALEGGVEYRVVPTVSGQYDSVAVTVATLPHDIAPDTHFVAPDSISHLYVAADVFLGRWSRRAGGYIVAGRDSDGFEHGLDCHPWQMGGSLPWTLDSTVSHSGRYSLRSGSIVYRQTSDLKIELTLPHSDSVSFWSRPSTEPQYDRLLFFVDGRQRYENWGEGEWSRKAVALSAGRHTLLWRYIKDESTNRGSDCVWLDDLQLPMALCEEPLACDGGDAPLAIMRPAAAEPSFRIYPNPASRCISVEGRGIVRVTIYDLYGREVYSTYANDRSTHDISRLHAGIYVVVLGGGERQEYHKLTIQR